MRIAYIHQYYADRTMSGGTRSYEFSRRLVERGHEVHMITTDDSSGGVRWRVTTDGGVTVHRLGVPYSNAMPYWRRLIAFAHFMLASTMKAISVRPDLVFATSTPLTVAVPGVLAARLHRVPFVFEVRDLWPEAPIEVGALRSPVTRRLAFALARFAYRNAERVVALSPGMARGVAAQGYPPDRITVVPNACDLDLFGSVPQADVDAFRRSLPWAEDAPVVVYAGTIGAVNGVEYLIRLAAQVRLVDPRVRFLIVGQGRERERVERLARELDVLDVNTFLLPALPKDQMPAVLAVASIAVSLFLPLPSMRDNSANKFFDALAAGRPVALNYGGWQAELVQETGAGMALDASDVAAAARDLVQKVTDPQWLPQAGAAARRLAEERFSRDLLFSRLERVLVAARAGRSGVAAGSLTASSARPVEDGAWS